MNYPLNQSFMADFGASLVANSYHVIPILPGQKMPGRYALGMWTPYPEWNKHCARPTHNFEIDIWQRWPECAVGIACGNVVGVDIDVLDDAAAFEIEKLARSMLGDTPAKRLGRAPKRMLIYRTEQPFAGMKRHPLEILGLGNQFVAYAIHPDTNKPYEWPNESLVSLDISDLPAITQEQAEAFLVRAAPMVPEHLRQRRLAGAGASTGHTGTTDPKGTPEAIRAALRFVPNADLAWDDWVKVGLAIKGALGEGGRDLWLDWSKSAGKSGKSGKSDTAEREWASFKPTKIGAGTLYWLAEQGGWVPDSELILNGNAAEVAEAPHPAAGLIAKALAMATSSQHSPTVAPGIMDVDGALKMLVDYSTDTAFSPQPFLALGAAIAAIGSLAGRRYASPTDLRTNVFIIGLADSSSGKDQPRKCIKRAFFEAGVSQYFGGERLASGQALYSSVEIHPARLFLLNEFGQLVSEIKSRNASSFQAAIFTGLTSLFTSASEVVFGTEYAHQKGSESRQRVDLHQPHVCVYGDTVANVLWRAMQSGALGDGSVARFLVFQSPDNCPDYNRSQAPMDVPAGLVEKLKAIAAGVPDHDYGGDIAALMSAGKDMRPYVVPYGPGVSELLRLQEDEQLAWKRENRNTWATAFIGRGVEHTIRVAMIRAISRDPAKPVITPPDILWSQQLVMHCLVTAMRETDANVADSMAEGNIKRLLDVIRKVGEAGITKTELLKQSRFLNTRERNSIIADLVETGDIWIRKEGETKPITRYFATPGRSWQRSQADDD